MTIGKMGIGVLACALLLGGTTGCRKLTRLLGEKAAEQVQKAGGGEMLGGPSAEEQAMSLYAQGFNILIDDPQECISEYTEDVPLEGPQAGKKYNFFPAHTRGTIEIAKAKELFENAAKTAPEELAHLQPLAQAVLGNLEQACSTFAEAHKYYDAEDYKDDEGKLGKELHQKMVKIAESNHQSLEKLEAALSAIEEQHMKAEIKEFEEEKSYSYWFRYYSFESKKLLNTEDPKEFEKHFKVVDTAHDGLAAFTKSKGAEANAAFQAFVSQADSFHSTAKKLSRALAEKTPNAQTIQNLQKQLSSSANSMVSVGNSLRELEANNLLK